MKNFIPALIAILIGFSSLYGQKTMLGTVDYSYNLKGQNAEAMAGMMPDKMVIKYGEEGVAVEMVGGMMSAAMGTTVVNGSTGEVFMVRDTEKTVYVMESETIKAEAEKVEKPEIIKHDETKTIMDYKCTKYVQSTTVDGTTISQTLWITDKLKAPDYNSDAFTAMGSQNTFYYDMEGFPMLIEIDMPNMPVSLSLEVVNIEFEKIDKSTFEKPEGYEEKPYSSFSPM